MFYADFSKGYILRIDRGEKFHESLLKFFEEKHFASAFFHGIGSLQKIDLGYFDAEKNDYIHHFFKEPHELISAMGNISLIDGKPIAHTHVTLGNKKCEVFGGHLFEGEVVFTAEIYFQPVDAALLRKKNKEFNFKELDLPHHFI